MIFNSLQFLVFFGVVVLLYFRFKDQLARKRLLLLAGCYFYMSLIPVYMLILGAMIVLDFFAGIQIDKNKDGARKAWLLVSLMVNLGTLMVFKYYNFGMDNLKDLFRLFHKDIHYPVLAMALPLGLSFHTFQALSYNIEVYRGNQKAEKSFLNYAIYIMFFPQLVSGPIERPQQFLYQLKEYRPYNFEHVKEGLARMMWGYFKKCVVADRLAIGVDYSYLHIHSNSSLALAVGAVMYTFQIYCDFSGYSDIAIGAAKVLNISLVENFNLPYISKSVTEFWRRWHMSLYSWFNDYLFNPVVTSLRYWGKGAIVMGLLVTFFLSGIWHGAGWTYISYGVVNGLALTFEFLTNKPRKKVLKALPETLRSACGWAATFCFGTLSYVFFRSKTIAMAFSYFKAVFSCRSGSNFTGLNNVELGFSALLIAFVIWRENRRPGYRFADNRVFYAYMVIMPLVCYFLGVFRENQFIYFQF